MKELLKKYISVMIHIVLHGRFAFVWSQENFGWLSLMNWYSMREYIRYQIFASDICYFMQLVHHNKVDSSLLYFVTIIFWYSLHMHHLLWLQCTPHTGCTKLESMNAEFGYEWLHYFMQNASICKTCYHAQQQVDGLAQQRLTDSIYGPHHVFTDEVIKVITKKHTPKSTEWVLWETCCV